MRQPGPEIRNLQGLQLRQSGLPPQMRLQKSEKIPHIPAIGRNRMRTQPPRTSQIRQPVGILRPRIISGGNWGQGGWFRHLFSPVHEDWHIYALNVIT